METLVINDTQGQIFGGWKWKSLDQSFFHLSDFVRPSSYYLKTDATLGYITQLTIHFRKQQNYKNRETA